MARSKGFWIVGIAAATAALPAVLQAQNMSDPMAHWWAPASPERKKSRVPDHLKPRVA